MNERPKISALILNKMCYYRWPKCNKNQRESILVKKNEGTGNIVIIQFQYRIKVEQRVRIKHDGIDYSNTLQIATVCSEIIKDNLVSIGEKSKYVVNDNLVSLE